jgi:hypothetical protein
VSCVLTALLFLNDDEASLILPRGAWIKIFQDLYYQASYWRKFECSAY